MESLEAFELFEDLPHEVQKEIILKESMRSGRLLSSTQQMILEKEFINNPSQ